MGGRHRKQFSSVQAVADSSCGHSEDFTNAWDFSGHVSSCWRSLISGGLCVCVCKCLHGLLAVNVLGDETERRRNVACGGSFRSSCRLFGLFC